MESERRKENPVYRRHGLMLGLMVGVIAAACVTVKETPSPPTVLLDRTVYFTGPDGGDAVAVPGAYRVEAAEESRLRLISVEGKESLVVQARAGTYREDILSPGALSFPMEEDAHHLILLQPGGKSLEAVGSHSGVRTRGPTQVPLFQFQAGPTSASTTASPFALPGVVLGNGINRFGIAGPVTGGGPSYGVIELTQPAPAGGAVMRLTSSHPTVTATHEIVTIPPGGTKASFPITINPVGQDVSVTITASGFGPTRTAALSVLAPVVAGFSPLAGFPQLSAQPEIPIPMPIMAGLTGPAPAAGISYSLSSNTPWVVTVPEFIGFGAGQTTGCSWILTSPVASPVSVTLSATSRAGVTKTATMMVVPYPSGTPFAFTLNPPSWPYPTGIPCNVPPPFPNGALGGAPVTGTVILSSPAPPTGAVVLLTSSQSPSVLTVPPNVTVPTGTIRADFPVTTNPTAQTISAAIEASYAGVKKAARLAILPGFARLISLTLNPTNVKGGGSVTGTIILNSPAPSQGQLVVILQNDNPSVASIPHSVVIPPGMATASFTVTTSPVAQTVQITITAFQEGSMPQRATLTVGP